MTVCPRATTKRQVQVSGTASIACRSSLDIWGPHPKASFQAVNQSRLYKCAEPAEGINFPLIRRKTPHRVPVLLRTQQPIARNGKPPATERRKATGLKQAAGLPNVIPHDAGRF